MGNFSLSPKGRFTLYRNSYLTVLLAAILLMFLTIGFAGCSDTIASEGEGDSGIRIDTPEAGNPDATTADETGSQDQPAESDAPSASAEESEPGADNQDASPDGDASPTGTPSASAIQPTAVTLPPIINEGAASEEIMNAITAMMEKMTLEEKVGQMICPAFRTTASGNPLLAADEATLDAIRTWKPGGIVLFSSNLDTVPQTVKFVRQLQESSAIPLLLGIDEEGGKVSRMRAAPGLGAVSMPPAAEIGETGNPEYAREAAAATGKQLSLLGINLDFAPVADINTNPENPVIGNRAYGTDPEETAAMVAAALTGYRDAGIVPVIKHFPGHGDTATDSHLGLAVVMHGRKRLDSVELVPFLSAMKAGAPVVMTAHVNTPGISSKDLPATLNPDILTVLLRNELKFTGVIVTDAMEMGAITETYGAGESIVMAAEAGADMMLVPVSLEGACKALLEAVRTGRISETRIDESVLRILTLKASSGLFQKKPASDAPIPQTMTGTDAYRELVGRIAAAAGE